MKLVSILLCTFAVIHISFGAPQVQLPNGIIIGRDAKTLEDKSYFAFDKIPYATPPLGELRFKAPVPPEDWSEPLETTNLNVMCYQVGQSGDRENEDCLYINVHTPQLPTEGDTVSLPVMVYIHGGGFVRGTSMGLNSDRIISEDIILVTLNYRLGPFGFLSTLDDVIPGNNGLKDQHLALKWVHDNIHLFGGDADKITIFGQSAGSASVAYHLLNQESQGLFSGAILESGTALCPWAFQRNATEIAFTTASFINDTFSTNRDSSELLAFLQSVDVSKLDEASDLYRKSISSLQTTEILQGFDWAPVVEAKNSDAFLTKKMYGLLKAGNVIKVPILIGMTSEEGLTWNQDKDATANHMASFDQNLAWLVPNDMAIDDEDTRTQMGSAIRKIYAGEDSLANNLAGGVRYYTDNSFGRAIIKYAEFFSSLADTYFYQFSYVGEYSHQGTTYDGAGLAGHSQENKYFFCSGSGCDMSDYSDSDRLTMQRLIRIWTNFAKYQNPTPEDDDLLQNIVWPLVNTENGDHQYVDIDENLEIKNHPKEEAYQKWVELYTSLGYDDFDTY